MDADLTESRLNDWSLSESFGHANGLVRYSVAGEGDPVVLLHGTPFSSYEWHRIAPIIAHHRRVYVYDMPGYGQSEKFDGQDVSLGAQTEVFAELLDHWGLDRPAVVAHDFGGAIALRAHLLKGVDYERLLLIDPVAARPWGSPFVQHVREHETAFAGAPDYLQRAIVAAYVRTAIRRSIPDEELEPYVTPWTGDHGQPALYRQIVQMDQRYTDEIEPHLGSVRCPVELLWGEEDAWIPIEQGRTLAQRLGVEQLQVIPRAGHLVQEDAPEAIVAAAYRFLGVR